MNNEVNNGQDILDSRDVIARIEELEAEIERMAEELEEHDELASAGVADKRESAREYLDECREELDSLKDFADDLEGYGDWAYGEALIRDSYFEDYAEELAGDCGMITTASMAWPARHIDWKAAAEELKQDYLSAEFDGVTYWMRA